MLNYRIGTIRIPWYVLIFKKRLNDLTAKIALNVETRGINVTLRALFLPEKGICSIRLQR